ncbi:MAG: ribosome silencing factor [Eubacteriales bacterium]
MEENRNEEIKSLRGAEPEDLAQAIADILDNKKAKDVKIIKVSDKTIIADYFVLANGNTSTHVRSLADEVEFKLAQAGVEEIRRDGGGGAEWRVLDYASVIVHIFDREAREFYKLDKLYSDFE